MAEELRSVADGVWLLQGGRPRLSFNVYLLEDDDGVTAFDAGVKAMAPAIEVGAAKLGGLRRVVLSHAHSDHRGAAPSLGVPVLCHPDEVADVEGDGGVHYSNLKGLGRDFIGFMLRSVEEWDGGPVHVDGTLEEGDRVAGFEVVHLPGHAPGLIALWRESDQLALVSDTLYTIDIVTGEGAPAHVPSDHFNWDTDRAYESAAKLASLGPAAVWTGHGDPVLADVAEALAETVA